MTEPNNAPSLTDNATGLTVDESLVEAEAIQEAEALGERIPGGRSLREHAARGVLINSAFEVGFAGLGLVRRLAVAAFLTRGEFGFWGILVSILITLSWLKQVGISDKYVQQTEADQELAFQKAFTLEVAYTICFFGLVAVALPAYALAYGYSSLLVPGFILSLAFLTSALQAPIWIAYRQMRFARQRLLEGIDPVLSTVITIALAVGGAGYWSLVIGAVVGSAASAAAAVATCPYRLAWRFDRTALRDYFTFSWPLFLSGASGIVIVQGAVLIGNYSFGLAGLGVMALATTFATFVDRVDDVVRHTIYPAVCAVQDRADLLYETFVKSNRLALMWALPFGVGLALFAPDLVSFVLGQKWQAAEGIIAAFGLILAFRQVAFNWTVFMRATGRTRPIFLNSLLLVGTFAVITAPLMIVLGLEGYAIGAAAGGVADLIQRRYFLAQLFERFDLFRHVVRAGAPHVIPVAAVLALRLVEPVTRTAGIAVGELAVYLVLTAGCTWIFERSLIAEMTGYLRGAPRPAAG